MEGSKPRESTAKENLEERLAKLGLKGKSSVVATAKPAPAPPAPASAPAPSSDLEEALASGKTAPALTEVPEEASENVERLQSENQSLKGALEKVRTELDQHVSQATKAEELAAELRDALATQKGELQRLQMENEGLQFENDGLKEMAEKAKKTKKSAKASKSDLKEKADLQKANEQLVLEREALAAKCKAYEDSDEKLRQKLRNMSQKEPAEEDEETIKPVKKKKKAEGGEEKEPKEKDKENEKEKGKKKEKGRPNAESVPSGRFEPQVVIYDLADVKEGLRRIVRVQAPGRYLEGDGRATVDGSVRAINGGVSIRLFKTADFPPSAQFCDPWVVDDPVGTWEWTYQPEDNAWELSESYGFAHGVFAFVMRQSSVLNSTRDTVPRVSDPLPSPVTVPVTPVKMSGWANGTKQVAAPPSRPQNSVAVLAPVSALKRSVCHFRSETVFLGADGNRIDADDIFPGILLLCPQGTVEVLEVIREKSKFREVASLSMGGEVLSVLVGTKIASVALTVDGAAAADWAYYDVRELQAGSHEVGLCTPAGAEATSPLQSMALLGQEMSTLGLEMKFDGKDRAVYVALEKSIQGYMYRSKQDAPTHPTSPFKPRSPFTFSPKTYTSPQHRRQQSRGNRFK